MSRLTVAPAPRALKACCLIIWLLHCSPTWAQEPNVGHFDLRRFPWESLPPADTDLVFLLDRSGSVGMAGFEMQLGFVGRFLKYFEVAPNATRVAVISFSDDAEVHADFLKEPGNKCQLVRRMQEAKYSNHYATNTGAGLIEALKVFHNSRPQTRKVLVLVTDGLATVGPDPVEEANKLKEAGIEVFVFGIGRSFRKHLESLASSEEHVFEFESFAEFETFDKGGPIDRWTVRDSPRDCDRLCRRSTDKGPDGAESSSSCCDKNAVCGCSLKSGLSACLCGPGFHGNGYRGQCAPCKPNTYKSTSDSGPCLSCPPHSGTEHEGSRSLKECVCKEGYTGNPGEGVPCSIVTCPPLQPPEHGRIVQCDNGYDGECLFECDQQYETEGGENTELRVCEAAGTWSGSTTVCKAKSCGKPQDLDNGYVSGCDSPWKVNDTCTFHCDSGYELPPGVSATRTCDEWKAWTGEDVHCEPVPCPAPPDVPNAIVGAVLKTKVYRFGEYFNPKCPTGFTLRGPRVLYCNERGQWDSGDEDHSSMACVDESRPTISCPPDMAVLTDPHSASALVSWNQPRYRDNAGGGNKLTLQQMPGDVVSPHRYGVGSHSIRFRVVDAAGLDATCSFTITVRDEERPQVLSCPKDISLETAEDDVEVTWEEPSFTDNSGSVEVSVNSLPGSKFGHGVHKVSYQARDPSGNYATCSFRVTVSKSQCPFYPAPLNGALSCDPWLHGQFCQPLCNDHFDFLEEPAEMYVCAKDRRWYTEPEGMPVPWPDCAKKSSPAEVKKKYHAYYYSGDCRNSEVQEKIKRAFKVNFEYVRSRLRVCKNGNDCHINDVTVRCGDMSELAEHLSGMRRAKRSVGFGAASTAGVDAEVVLEFGANGTSALGNDTEELAAAIDEIVESIGEIAPSVLEKVRGEENVTVQMDLIEASAEDVVIVCAKGQTLSSQGCAKCPKGTFHDRSLGVCTPCPTGSYQDEEGTVSCKLCPEGAATAAPKSTSVDDCQLVCSPGTFSKDGLETCLACPLGTYQEKRQQTRCKPCPKGSTTEAFGSSQETDCKKYCAPGSYSDSGLQPCTPCKRGTYQNLSGQKSCAQCPAPTSSLHEGSTSIFDCVDVDHCASNPCHNKTCVAQQHGFNCEDY